MYEEIAKRIAEGYDNRNMTAVFHFQVLKNAHLLAGVDPIEFCKRVGVQESYQAEYRKMMSVAKLMAQLGVELTEKITG